MKRPPLILITTSTEKHGVEFKDTSSSLSDRYCKAVVATGGLPWMIPCLPDGEMIRQCVARCDGVMLTGGHDVEPELYGAELTPRLRKTLGVAEPERDMTELLIIKEVFQQRKPLFAICRGIQILNVALGGTLVVDIGIQLPKAKRHDRTDMKDKLVHDMLIEPGSQLAKVFGKTRVPVNSSHHQALLEVAPLLRVSGSSPDGIAEGIELSRKHADLLPYFIGVQFHPERLFDKHSEFVRLFQSFTKTCLKGGIPKTT